MLGAQASTGVRVDGRTAGTAELGVNAAQAAIVRLFADELRAEAPTWDDEGGIPASAFERLAGVGAFAARWPSREDRFGELDVGACLIRELALSSLGACIAAGTHTEAFFRALTLAGVGEELWDAALAGERIGALGITERQGGSNPTNCETLAERDGDDWVLSGHKHYVSNLRAATDAVLFTRTARRGKISDFTLFVVPLDAPGVAITPHHLVGARASGTCMVDLDRVRLGDERRVGRVGSGLSLLMEMLRYERLLSGCAALAVAELCLEMALAFVSGRDLDGAPLREHPITVHRLAELAADVAAGQALIDRLLADAREGAISTAEAATAKLVLTRTAWRTADATVQIFAGRGFTEETPLARIWRDIRIGRIGGGTDEVLLELIGRSLKPGPLAEHPAVVATAAAVAVDERIEGDGP